MEKEFKITIPNTNLSIYAKQYGELDKPTIIFVHGLTGHMDEHMFYNGARYFHKHGISSIRFNLYDAEEDARDLVDCTLKTHADDLNQVIDYARKQGVKKLFAIGHSYGGPTILLSKHTELDAAMFWDPAYGYTFDDTKEIEGTDLRYFDWGINALVGPAMYSEAQTFDQASFVENFSIPLQVVTAEKSYYKEREKNVELVPGEKEYAMIKGAGHTFSEEGAADQLFQVSLNWIQKHI